MHFFVLVLGNSRGLKEWGKDKGSQEEERTKRRKKGGRQGWKHSKEMFQVLRPVKS